METRDYFFLPAAGVHQLDVAYCGAILEAISYTNNEALLNMWRQSMGFQWSQKITTPDRVTPNLMVVGDATRMIVAVPGTMSLSQMGQNLRFCATRENADFGAGRFVSFFLWCAESIVSFVQSQLSALPNLQEMAFVGHSLGGAVAQLLADWVAQNTSINVRLVQAFNSPRVYNQEAARRSRFWHLHHYYNVHDIICELPPPVLYTSNSLDINDAFYDWYEHRDTLIPLQSERNINESWAAVSVAKVAEPAAAYLRLTGTTQRAATIAHRLHLAGFWSGLASWVLPLPIWYLEHSIESVLDNIERMRDFTPPIENVGMVNLRAAIQAEGVLPVNPYLPNSALAPPTLFGSVTAPLVHSVSQLLAPTPGTRFEIVETACEWTHSAGGDPIPNLAYIDDAFVNALAARALSSPDLNPLLSTTPILADMTSQPHWFYRGQDRRLLEKLHKCLWMIEIQDALRAGDALTSRISTLEPIVDPEDDELLDAFALIRGHVGYLLGMERA